MRKPHLAQDADLDKMKFPVAGMPKIDGVRIINLDGNATARSLMPHANLHTTKRFSQAIYTGIDGEGAVGNICSKDLCRTTTSALNTIAGEPNVVIHAFDFIRDDTINLPFIERYRKLRSYVWTMKPEGVVVVPVKIIRNKEQALAFYKWCLDCKYEGAIFRSLDGVHKDGRCTVNENAYMRMKPSSDKDALVLSIEEAMKNNNEKTINALGHSERSSHKANKTGKGMVGALICNDLTTNQTIRVMAGKMKHDERTHYFINPELIVGHYIKYRSTDTGVKDAPRFGRFISLRSKEDIVTE